MSDASQICVEQHIKWFGGSACQKVTDLKELPWAMFIEASPASSLSECQVLAISCDCFGECVYNVMERKFKI